MKISTQKSLHYKLHFKDKPFFRHYDLFGSHIKFKQHIQGVQFRVWAPNAKEVRISGNFNNWNGKEHVMKKNKNTGIWSLFIPNLVEFDIYKYEITTPEDNIILKSDPYAFYSEHRPDTASVIVNLNGYAWNDRSWLQKRSEASIYDKPMNIYELHLGSWRRTVENEFKNYKTLADEIVEYVLQMGYTHVELMPVSEHPLDASWGYQSTGYYSLTSRFGVPQDFMYFVDKLHENNIGVILDWVPGHFCKDAHGLYKFDGTALYEYSKPVLAENYGWGTANFDFSKPEVQRYLIANALFWFDIYHIDGMRVDAVANILYLDYGKDPHHELKNKYGGNENLEAIEFLKKLNKIIFKNFSNVLMIAEDSSTFPGVTTPTYIGGLGFNYKWNMGWMNDMLKFMSMDSVYRKWHHNLITFSLMYAFTENFVLPLSHDEVVHGKKSLLDKMPGDYWQKFAGLRLLYGYMIAHPGKKLLFMGGEFGQFIEWRYAYELDWFLLLYPPHKSMQEYVKALNSTYKEENTLWEIDHSYDGFSWIDHQNFDQSIISFMRKGKDKDDFLIVVCNFTAAAYENYKIGVPSLVEYKEILNSDSAAFGGSNVVNEGLIMAKTENWHNQPHHIEIRIPPLAVTYIKPQNKKPTTITSKGGKNYGKKRDASNDTGRRTGK